MAAFKKEDVDCLRMAVLALTAGFMAGGMLIVLMLLAKCLFLSFFSLQLLFSIQYILLAYYASVFVSRFAKIVSFEVAYTFNK